MRGYFWEDLARDVAAEFESLTPESTIEAIQQTPRVRGPLWAGEYYWARLEWLERKALGPWGAKTLAPKPPRLPAKTAAERMSATRERRRAEGKCYNCETVLPKGHTRCNIHAAKVREAGKRYEAKQRAKRVHK